MYTVHSVQYKNYLADIFFFKLSGNDWIIYVKNERLNVIYMFNSVVCEWLKVAKKVTFRQNPPPLYWGICCVRPTDL